MSEPEITVNELAYGIPVSREILEDADGFRAAAERLLSLTMDPNHVPPKPWEGEPITPPPIGYIRLREAMQVRHTPLLADLVELHGPRPWLIHTDGTVYRWDCQGCDADGYDWEYPTWPCRTSELIAERLGVELNEEET